MGRRWAVWSLVWLALFTVAWLYAATLAAPPSAAVTLLPLEIEASPATVPALRPLPAAGAPTDPFAPAGAAPAPASPPPDLPPVPLPPPPLPEAPAPPESAPAPAAEGAPFKLTGVVIGSVRRAVLEAKETAYIVKEGDTVEGWTVLRIEARRVVLRGPGGEAVTLELESGSSPAPSP